MPSSVAFVALGPVIVGALFQTGRFGDADTLQVGGVLAAYGVGLLGQASVKLFASGFYALRDTKTPVKIASLSLLVSGALAYGLMRWYGAAGIALGSSLGATLNVVLNLRGLDLRIGRVLGRADWVAFATSVVAALVAGAAGMGAALLGAELGLIARALSALGVFAAAYGAVTLVLKHPDAVRLWTSLR
jgi:putative peptidoglycan lipid II flippase